ncbi:MAG TPA: 2-C-methyl-D-erythritol 4-phosphate cytidylyltransferase [Gammaproteobacteria bacterium]|nr:2-C-methyl-D-erythritol 4-phosphate cytidylyltransferase [Gammaproteobacteria bacterium]
MPAWALIPAAGTGERFGAGSPKQYLPLAGRPMLAWTLELFLASPRIDGVIVALAAGDRRWSEVAPADPSKPVLTTIGGATRAASVLAALDALAGRLAENDWVLVHDAARACLGPDAIEKLFAELGDDRVGGILATPLADTLKRADGKGRIATTMERAGLWLAQTPQMFRYGLLRSALAAASRAGVAITDEAMAMERAGFAPRLVTGNAGNLKITRADDLALAEALIGVRRMLKSPP